MTEIRSIADFSVSQLIDAIIKNWDNIKIFGSTKRKQKKYLLSRTPLELLLLYNEIQAVKRANRGTAS